MLLSAGPARYRFGGANEGALGARTRIHRHRGAGGLIAASAGASAQSQSSIQLVAMDADPAGNTATSLGHLDPCVRAEPGSEVTVDLVVDSVPEDRPFLGFQIEVVYEPTVLEVTGVRYDYLLAANGSFQPFDGLSEPLPDADGSFKVIIADLASVPPAENMETGEGVLLRLAFTAKTAGTSSVAPGYDPPDVYPALIDGTNSVIEVRTIAGIEVVVGEDCPPGQTAIEPTELPPVSAGIPAPVLSPTPVPSATHTFSPADLPVGGSSPDDGAGGLRGVSASLALGLAAILASGALWLAARRLS